jgi:hypothetical protein
MLVWGILGDYTGRKWGSRCVAAIMLSGAIMLTFTPYAPAAYAYVRGWEMTSYTFSGCRATTLKAHGRNRFPPVIFTSPRLIPTTFLTARSVCVLPGLTDLVWLWCRRRVSHGCLFCC